MTNPLDIYQQQILNHKTELKKLEKRGGMFGWLRFLSIALAFISIWWIWKNGSYILLPVTVLFIALFLFILAKHLANNAAIENLQRLIRINETEIQVLGHHFTQLPDGSEYKPENHEYAMILIFLAGPHCSNMSIAVHQNKERNYLQAGY